MAADTVESIKKEIASFEAIINNPNTSAGVKSSMETVKKRAEEKLKKLEEAEAKSEKRRRAALDAFLSHHGKKTATHSEKKAAVKKAAGKHYPSMTVTNAEDNMVTVHYHGKTETFDISKCEGAIKALIARKERDKETSAKSKSRLPIEKAATAIEHAATHITNLADDKKIENEPEKVIKAVEKADDGLYKGLEAMVLAVGGTQAQADKLVGTVKKVINDFLDEIKKGIGK